MATGVNPLPTGSKACKAYIQTLFGTTTVNSREREGAIAAADLVNESIETETIITGAIAEADLVDESIENKTITTGTSTKATRAVIHATTRTHVVGEAWRGRG